MHVVAIGGGGGAGQVLQAVQPFAGRRTAIIAVTDTGRSTGLARAIGAIPAPGDLRATIAAFAEDRLIAELLQHRFDGTAIAQLEGMAFGNLLIAALARVTGDFTTAVAYVAELAECAVTVLPVSRADAQLCAELADGSMVYGELAVRGLNKPPIKRLFLAEAAEAYPAALDAIRDADLVVLGPGSLFTTLLATLLFDGMAEALYITRGKVVFVCNTTTQPGQTDTLRMVDHVQRVMAALGPATLDAVLVNRATPDAAALQAYEAEGLFLLRPDAEELAATAALGIEVMVRDLSEPPGEKRAMWNKQDTLRHDPLRLGSALRELLA
ncbi:MAG TPA: YvcK family protein [Roseiflexaceae bacterium]|nr:YvcK family protein [Roseiflexaceae bacterium]HMP42084.1 YvcK family protein [Roseiflexaceae bacterium]